MQATPSLADVVAGVSAKAMVDSIDDAEVMSAFPKVGAYVTRLGGTEAIRQALTDMDDFAKVTA